MVATQQLLLTGAGTPPVTDPLFSKVVFLTDGVGTLNATTLTDQSSFHHVMTTAGAGSKIDNAHVEYGATSIKSFNTTSWSAPDSPAWDISSANSDEFCVEYSVYQTDRGSTYDYFSQLPGGGNYAWLSRHNGADWIFYWSVDGSAFSTLTASGGVGPVNVFNKYCIEKNSAGKLRLYVNGLMKTSSTPANSAIFHSSGAIGIVSSGAAQSAWFANARITKGVGAARYNIDTSYAVATGPFPTS